MVRRVRLWSLSIFGAFSLALWLSIWMLLAPKIPVPQRSDRMIANVTIWNPGEPLQPNQTIGIADGRIAEVRPVGQRTIRRSDPGSRYSPGLIDAHVHTPPQLAIGNQRLFSLHYPKYGVTTVRDLGQTDDSIAGLQADIAEGQIAGARMCRCGPVLDGEQPSWPSALRIVDGPQAISAVKTLKAGSASCIKAYTGLSEEAFRAAAAEAKRQGLPLLGHTPHAVNLRDASGFEVQHFNGIPYLHKPLPEDADYRSQDVTAMTEADSVEVIALMKANRITILPTQANQKARLTATNRQRFPPTEGLRHLPAFWEKAWPLIVAHPETTKPFQMILMALQRNWPFQTRLAGRGSMCWREQTWSCPMSCRVSPCTSSSRCCPTPLAATKLRSPLRRRSTAVMSIGAESAGSLSAISPTC